VVVGPLKKGLRVALPVIIIFFLVFQCLPLFWVSSLKSVDSRNIFYTLIQGCFNAYPAVFSINFLCIAFGAMLISVFTVKHEIVDKQNYIPAFLYIFFCALTLNKNLAHPALFANIFILLALNEITDSYRQENVLSRIFNAAFYTCLAFFFYINYAFFILLFFVTLSILRPFNWKEWVISLVGFFSVLFMYACVGYLANYDFSEFFINVGELLVFFQKPSISEYFYPLFISIWILLGLAIFKYISGGAGGTIKTQKTMSLVYWFLVLSVINFFSKNNSSFFPVIASVIPLSILLGDYFFNIKQLKIANTLFFFLLASGAVLFLMQFNVI